MKQAELSPYVSDFANLPRMEDESVELITGSMIILPGGVPHKLVARRASLMLVTVSE